MLIAFMKNNYFLTLCSEYTKVASFTYSYLLIFNNLILDQ